MAVMLVAVAGQLTVRPVVGLTTEERLTEPAKLKVLVRLTETAAPAAPELKFTGVPTEMVKSPTWTTELAEWDAVPGEPTPVMVTRYVPGVEEFRVQDAGVEALAVNVTAVAGQATVNPVVGLTTDVRVTLPAKLKVLVRLTEMAAPIAPVLKFTEPVAEIVKSPTWTTEDAEWDAVPGEPAPVTATRYVPAVAEVSAQEALAVPLADKLVAVAGQVTVKPAAGLTTDVRATVPAKLFTLVSETEIAAPVAPELKLTGVPTLIVKSPTCTIELAE